MRNTLNKFYKKVIRYDLINKFNYKNIDDIPKLKKIVLNFGCKNSDTKKLATSLLALKLITNKKGTLMASKKPHIFLKIRKGNPVSCVVTLKNSDMYCFLKKLLFESFPFVKNFKTFKVTKKIEKIKSFSFTFDNLITFKELESHFYLFRSLPSLNITLVTTSNFNKEMFFLLQSLKIPFKL